MKNIVSTNCLCKQYKDLTALSDVSIHVPKGSIYGLIGNNGAGKTTLMRILSNLQNATSGSVTKAPNLKSSAIIESPALYPTLSARGNLKYQIQLTGKKDTDIEKLLNLVHLPDTKKPAIHLSLGMKQRLGLAMTLVDKPDFLLLDEPLNGLDPEGINDMRSIIQKLNQDYNITILISSHLLGELQKVATDYGFLKNGTLLKEFSSNELANGDLESFYFEQFSTS